MQNHLWVLSKGGFYYKTAYIPCLVKGLMASLNATKSFVFIVADHNLSENYQSAALCASPIDTRNNNQT